mmetsp:Transcript_118044/g.280223  ORF Transcript_118044/g.280223 Transcript_118044/m.280223 type:complete len:311 (-) Transcript_118044:1592-2524(-)
MHTFRSSVIIPGSSARRSGSSVKPWSISETCSSAALRPSGDTPCVSTQKAMRTCHITAADTDSSMSRVRRTSGTSSGRLCSRRRLRGPVGSPPGDSNGDRGERGEMFGSSLMFSRWACCSSIFRRSRDQATRARSSASCRCSMVVDPNDMSIPRLTSVRKRNKTGRSSWRRVLSCRSSTQVVWTDFERSRKAVLASSKFLARLSSESAQFLMVSRGTELSIVRFRAEHIALAFTRTWLWEFSTAYSRRILHTWLRRRKCSSSGLQMSMRRGISGKKITQASFIRRAALSLSFSRAIFTSSSACLTAASMM